MRIATYNIWNSATGMPERKQQLIEEIIKISADIICLQEVPNKAAHQDLVERCRYQFAVFHEHANEEEGLSILSRYSIKSFEYDQNCIFAKIEIQNKTLLLINTHLPWDSAVNRELVVLNVMEKIEGISFDYVIFLGDFNCSERSGVNQFLLGEMTLKGRDCGKNWYDLAEAYAERHNIATDNTLDIKSNPRWKGLKSIEVSRRYDRILVRNTYPMDLPILEKCETFGRTISEKSGYAASDHYGVYADLYLIVREYKMNRKIPDKILEIVGNQSSYSNNVGMSDSEVLIYPDYVLKIQAESEETKNEKDIVAWLDGQVPVPGIPVYYVEDGTAYTLMTRITGKMLCDEEYLNNPKQLIRCVAEGLRTLWKVDVTKCPFRTSRLEERLKQARWNVENNLVDMENVETETFGEGGFRDPEELICWLEVNRPKEDIVFTHGDFCLPNVFVENNRISGFIDLGKMGPADRWQDIAIALRSLNHNFAGHYNGGKKYFDFTHQMLLEELELDMDYDKFRYYILLDELF